MSGGSGSGGRGMSGGRVTGGWPVPKMPSNCEIISPKDGPDPPVPPLLGPGMLMLIVTLFVAVFMTEVDCVTGA
jgi:hypothetical protein